MSLGRTVAELRESISSEEFAYWLAMYQLEPWGAEAGYIQAGTVAAMIANVNCDLSKRDPFSAYDFMPFHDSEANKPAPAFDPDPEKQSAAIEKALKGISPSIKGK